MSIKLTLLEVENFKAIKAVRAELSQNGLTVIGGANAAGKTSVLDAIAYALGGERYRPTNADRDGSVVPAEIRIELSNGLVIQRKGKTGKLTVTDSTGTRHGQSLLNSFITTFAIDMPKFMAMTDKQKTQELLNVLGVGDELVRLDKAEKACYDQRHAIGQVADRLRKHAESMPYHADAPEVPHELAPYMAAIRAKAERNAVQRQIEDLTRQLATMTDPMPEIDATRLQESIARMEDENALVRANLEAELRRTDAEEEARKYDAKTQELTDIRAARVALLDGANLPLPELCVAGGQLTYKGQPWDCMSTAEQYIVSAAIASAINPECGFVLLDRLESMDAETLRAFGDWLKSKNLQAIGTKVSTDGDCTITIEDGMYSEPSPTLDGWDF